MARKKGDTNYPTAANRSYWLYLSGLNWEEAYGQLSKDMPDLKDDVVELWIRKKFPKGEGPDVPARRRLAREIELFITRLRAQEAEETRRFFEERQREAMAGPIVILESTDGEMLSPELLPGFEGQT